MLQTCTALIKKNGAVVSLQKVEIRDTVSLTEDETSDPFVFSREWPLTSGTIHLGWYCASTTNRTVEGLKVLWVILQGRPSLECTHEKVEAHPQECPELRIEYSVPAWGSEGETDLVEGCFFNPNPSSSLSLSVL